MQDLRRSLLATALGFFLVISAAAPPSAWDATGHRVVGRIAQNHLAEKTRRAIEALLDGGDSDRCSAAR